MQDLSGACFNANKHGMSLVSLAIIKRDFFAQIGTQCGSEFLAEVVTHRAQTKRLTT